ncbi:hypothetical protein ZWY2020_029512 [Hordeum vulgare]|nr:hypothetical protein ZWY2020_029512 [Hordeum vulgare]
MGASQRPQGSRRPHPEGLSTSAATLEGEAVAAKAKRSKKKNLFDMVQFLPDWGVNYKVAKTTWMAAMGRRGGFDTRHWANHSNFKYGANFTITGTTALDTSYFEARGLGAVVWNSGALMTQIQWFRDLKPFFCNSTKNECKEFYANSLFVVDEFGGDDYNAPFFVGKGLTEAYKFMPDVIQGISDGVEVAVASSLSRTFARCHIECNSNYNMVQELIAEGAVDLIVPGVMPTGCSSST